MPSDTRVIHPENIRVGATIRELREAHELTITELARAIGVSRGLMSLIESGSRKATLANCRAIARVLGVPLAAITVEGYEQIADPQPATAR
jgi:transcriptional regulator with XRE-family HTH domain